MRFFDPAKFKKKKPWQAQDCIAVHAMDGQKIGELSIFHLDEVAGRGLFDCAVEPGEQVYLLLKVPTKQFWHTLRGTPSSCETRDAFNSLIRYEKYRKVRRKQVAKNSGDVRRLREVSAPGFHDEAEWQALLQRFGGICLRCGSAENITKDHVEPLSEGGSNYIDNLQPLCRSCNSWKATRTIDFRDNRCQKSVALPVLAGVPGSGPADDGGRAPIPCRQADAGTAYPREEGHRGRLLEPDQTHSAE
jgi:5-methylcytosine-specific restriction endonuclease McrA